MYASAMSHTRLKKPLDVVTTRFVVAPYCGSMLTRRVVMSGITTLWSLLTSFQCSGDGVLCLA